MAGHGLIPTAAEIARVRDLIAKWKAHRSNDYCRIKGDLYQVRNAGWKGNPPLSTWPTHLVDPDDVINAAVEHYFLCRCWVGTGVQPAWQMRQMRDIYNFGKVLGVTPQHNPNNPVTPFSGIQTRFSEEGIRDGEADLRASGRSAPWISRPPSY